MSWRYDADGRARTLLLRYLTPEQRRTYELLGYFDVEKTGARRSLELLLLWYPRFRVYRLSSTGRYPVTLFTSPKRLAHSRPKYCFCIHSDQPAPRDDELLSMKLLLETDEARFASIANRYSAASIERANRLVITNLL